MYVLETLLPDGPHWFAGIRRTEKEGKIIEGPEWSPYWEDRKEMAQPLAVTTLAVMFKNAEDIKVVSINEALKRESRTLCKDGTVKVRLGYVQKGWTILRLTVFYLVHKITDKSIVIVPVSATNGLKMIGGATQEVGKNSKEWVHWVPKEGGNV